MNTPRALRAAAADLEAKANATDAGSEFDCAAILALRMMADIFRLAAGRRARRDAMRTADGSPWSVVKDAGPAPRNGEPTRFATEARVHSGI